MRSTTDFVYRCRTKLIFVFTAVLMSCASSGVDGQQAVPDDEQAYFELTVKRDGLLAKQQQLERKKPWTAQQRKEFSALQNELKKLETEIGTIIQRQQTQQQPVKKKICPGRITLVEKKSGVAGGPVTLDDAVAKQVKEYMKMYSQYIKLCKQHSSGGKIDRNKYAYLEGQLGQSLFMLQQQKAEKLVPDWKLVKTLLPYLDKRDNGLDISLPKQDNDKVADALLKQMRVTWKEYIEHLQVISFWRPSNAAAWLGQKHRLAEEYCQLQDRYLTRAAKHKLLETEWQAINQGLENIAKQLKPIDQSIERLELEAFYAQRSLEAWEENLHGNLGIGQWVPKGSKGATAIEFARRFGKANAEAKLDEANKKIDAERARRSVLQQRLMKQMGFKQDYLDWGELYANLLLKAEATNNRKFTRFRPQDLQSDDLPAEVTKLLGERGTAIYKHQKGLRDTAKLRPKRKCP